MTRQYASACARNREPILAVLREVLATRSRVLEIGSGTGQHAVYFGPHLSHLQWQTSDLPASHASINAWREAEPSPNVLPPLVLDMNDPGWLAGLPDNAYDAIFSANTSHIMSWQQVQHLFAGIGALLPPGGVFALYGPFNYNGQFTSEGNALFDQTLRSGAAHMGIRDVEAIDALARAAGLTWLQDVAMPANNRILVWVRDGTAAA